MNPEMSDPPARKSLSRNILDLVLSHGLAKARVKLPCMAVLRLTLTLLDSTFLTVYQLQMGQAAS